MEYPYLTSFVTKHNIYKGDVFNSDIIAEDDIKKYIMSISEFHKRLAYAYDNKIRLISNIGKEVEEIKRHNKIIKRFILSVLDSGSRGALYEFLKLYGMDYLKETSNILDTFYDEDYLKIIRRSMERQEICLINTKTTNINHIENFNDNIIVKNLNDCCYNLVEVDYANFIIYLIKKEPQYVDNLNKIIEYCLKVEDLCEFSGKFIKAYVSYPFDFSKYMLRFIQNKREWDEEQLIEKLLKTINKKVLKIGM